MNDRLSHRFFSNISIRITAAQNSHEAHRRMGFVRGFE